MRKKIIITGGSGRFGQILKKIKTNHSLFFPSKKELDILNLKKIEKYFSSKKPNAVVHLAGFSRPMSNHEKNFIKSIDLNIIGTANITKVCAKKNIKLIYFSTNYVYPGTKGNYKEIDPVKPVNNYAWSKLGGEASVHLYKNSLILRVCMTEKPFVHKKAYKNAKTSFLYQDDVAKILFKLIDKKGIINIGGKSMFIYDFAKKDNQNVKKIFLKKGLNKFPLNSSINSTKLKTLLKSNKRS
tara:strand:- start:397 stop:1119 length:723 start_codon:yes stop_codon:yes gene_type:complete